MDISIATFNAADIYDLLSIATELKLDSLWLLCDDDGCTFSIPHGDKLYPEEVDDELGMFERSEPAFVEPIERHNHVLRAVSKADGASQLQGMFVEVIVDDSQFCLQLYEKQEVSDFIDVFSVELEPFDDFEVTEEL